MKRILTALLAFGFLFWTPALAQYSSGDEYLKEMHAIADALEGVEDDASAKEAASLMAAAIARARPHAETIDGWSDTEKRDYFMEYGDDFRVVHQRISDALMKMVRNPEYMEMFIEHMKNMPRVGQ